MSKVWFITGSNSGIGLGIAQREHRNLDFTCFKEKVVPADRHAESNHL